MTTYLSRSIYPNASGSQSDFSVTMPYLAKSHVHVYSRNAAGVLTEYLNGFSWSSSSLIHFTAPPAAGLTIEIWRKTPKADLLNRIGSPSIFTSKKVNDMVTQVLYITQETEDETTDLNSRALLSPVNETAPGFPSLTGAIGKMLVAVSSTVLAFLTPSEAGIAKGDPGGNAASIGTFTIASTLNIPVGTDVVETSGYASVGKGQARYVYDAAVDAAFVTAHPAWSFRSLNGRGFRLDPAQAKIWIEAFGAAGDATPAVPGTDDNGAFLAAKDFQEYSRFSPTGNTDYKIVPAVHFDRKGYRMSATWNLDKVAYRFYGTGYNFDGYGGSVLFFDAGMAGIVLQNWDTEGLTMAGTFVHHTYGTDPRGASNTHLADFTLQSRGGTVGTEDQSGLIQHCSAVIDRVHCFDFGGNGLAVVADSGSGSNANASQWNDCGAQRCGLNGFYDLGGDANAGRNLSFQAFNNMQFGIYAGNFLGQFYLWFQTDGNGISGSGPSWRAANTSTVANYGGNHYRVRPGQHVAAATTQPGTDSTIWVFMGAGSSGLGPTWTSGGQTWSSGGAFYAGGSNFQTNNNSRNVFAGYAEGNQADAWSDSNTSACLPGFSSWTGANLFVSNNKFWSGAIGAKVGGVTAGHVINVNWGYVGGAFDNCFGQLGNSTDETQNWSFHISDTNEVYQRYLGADSSEAYRMYPPASAVGFGCLRGLAIQNSQQFSGTAAPTTGAHTRGQIVWNETPTAGGTMGWVCTTAGTPGTWKTFGTIAA